MPRSYLLSLVIILAASTSIDAAGSTDSDALLAAMGQTSHGWSLPIDSYPRDQFRLLLVEQAMEHPWLAAGLADSLADSWLNGATPLDMLSGASALLGIYTNSDRLEMVPELLKGLPKDWPRNLQRGLSVIAACIGTIPKSSGAPSRHSINAVLNGLLPWPEEGSALPCELTRHERTTDAEARAALETMVRSQLIHPIAAASTLVWGMEQAAHMFESCDSRDLRDLKRIKSDHATGDLIFEKEYDWGLLLVGGPGPTIYTRPAAIIIDLGGNDVYLGPVAASDDAHPYSLCLDVSGNDSYTSSDTAGIAAGVRGVGILMDLDGHDTYRGGCSSLGAGIAGVGMLVDYSGDDVYTGTSMSQAAAIHGLGLLMDLGGNDLYSADFAGQGFAHVGAVGALVDVEGTDRYMLGGTHTDLLRYEDHALSMGQGFGFGYRPFFSGGIGLLMDGGGNDSYQADIFGQGASYWYALGALIDRTGNDTYAAYQYVQGAGVHLAAAALIDGAGNDCYFARGVSQGCGHDLAVGHLLDRTGDDAFVAYDLSQGAGSANGIGIMEDESGDDAYAVIRQANSQGYGNPRRHYGSMGIFLDKTGSDVFATPTPSAAWRRGVWGIGWDAPDSGFPAEEPENPDSISLSESLQACGVYGTYEALFYIAARGEPRFASAALAARDSLVMLGERSFPFLLDFLGSTRPRDRWTLEDLFRRFGNPGLIALTEHVLSLDIRQDEDALSTGLWIIGRILELDSDSVLAPVLLDSLRRYSGHPNRRVRSSLAYAMTEARIPECRDVLISLARDSEAVVRMEAVRGLSPKDGVESRDQLLKALEDPHPGVAYGAASSLASDRTAAFEHVQKASSERAQLAVLAALGVFPEQTRTRILETWATDGASDIVRSLAASLNHQSCDEYDIPDPLRSLLNALATTAPDGS